MKDFGSLGKDYTTCSRCGSGNHETWQHNALNDAAPELLAALQNVLSRLQTISRWEGQMPCRDVAVECGEELIRAAIAEAEGRQ